MTRGTFVLITDNGIRKSLEFNGDMYPDGHGLDAIRSLQKVNSVEEFENMVTEFNKTHHNYDLKNESPIYEETLEWFEKARDFNNEYFDYWFSDWLFIKNISSKEHTFTYRESENTTTLYPSGVLVVTFGHEPDGDDARILETV